MGTQKKYSKLVGVSACIYCLVVGLTSRWRVINLLFSSCSRFRKAVWLFNLLKVRFDQQYFLPLWYYELFVRH